MDADEILSLLEERNGEYHCPIEDCTIWYPAGVEYGFLNHFGEHDVCLICGDELEHPGNEFICTTCAAEFDGESQ